VYDGVPAEYILDAFSHHWIDRFRQGVGREESHLTCLRRGRWRAHAFAFELKDEGVPIRSPIDSDETPHEYLYPRLFRNLTADSDPRGLPWIDVSTRHLPQMDVPSKTEKQMTEVISDSCERANLAHGVGR
jgi:hypothetical protein